MKKSTVKSKKAAPKSSPRRKSAENGFGAESYEALTNGYEALVKSNLARKFQKNISRNELLLGLLAMGVVGGTTLMVLNHSSKNKKSNQMSKTYNNFKDRAEEAYECAADYAGEFKEKAQEMLENPVNHPVLLGALGGTLLGASALYFMNNKGDFSHTEEALDKMKSVFGAITNAASKKNSKGWLLLAKEVLESVNENGSKSSKNSKLQTALDAGINGLSMLETMMKKR